jgi:hypothetical protein
MRTNLLQNLLLRSANSACDTDRIARNLRNIQKTRLPRFSVIYSISLNSGGDNKKDCTKNKRNIDKLSKNVVLS